MSVAAFFLAGALSLSPAPSLAKGFNAYKIERNAERRKARSEGRSNKGRIPAAQALAQGKTPRSARGLCIAKSKGATFDPKTGQYHSDNAQHCK